MSEREARAVLEEVLRRSKPSNEWLPHTPTDKQRAFLELPDDEALYGGAAGGGKSDALLMDQLRWVHVPGFAGLILRRTFPQLMQSDGLIPRSREWLSGTAARWNEQQHRWTFPSTATLTFGHMQYEADKYNYQGGAYHRVAWDELTQFTETQYTYVQSRVRRRTASPVPLASRAASNPGGEGHDWVKARFVEPGDPSRPFIAALLRDNPHLDAESYRRALSKLDSTTRAQLEDGLWIRDSGGLIYPYTAANVVKYIPDAVLPGLRNILAIDLGSSASKATTAFAVCAYHEQLPGVWVRRAEVEANMWPRKIADRIRELEAEYGVFDRVVIDEGGLGRGYSMEFSQEHGIGCEAAEKSQKLAHRRHLRGALRDALVMFVEADCQPVLQEMQVLAWNAAGTDCEPGASDHATDAVLYGWRACPAYASEPPATRLDPTSPDELARREEQEWLERDIEEAERRRTTPFWAR